MVAIARFCLSIFRAIRGLERVHCQCTLKANSNPRYLAWRQKVPWLRYGYSPNFVPWLKENAKRYDAIVINGLWNFTSLAAWRALSKTDARYFVYTTACSILISTRRFPIKAVFKQLLWWFSEERLVNNASAVMFVSEEERVLRVNRFGRSGPTRWLCLMG